MPKSKSNYPELNEIRQDIDSLKDNVVALTKHVQKDGVNQVDEISDIAKTRLAEIQQKGQKEILKVEKQVKAKPAQSVAIAFAGGLIASLLLRGRR
ncbi:MAG: hypothetical protein GW778_07445 [Alphaproteobacteria bacterium]|nr:hypothetical protein [Alphaproteobacteria bacterium]